MINYTNIENKNKMFHEISSIVESDKTHYNNNVIYVIYEINYMESNYA